MEFLDFHCMRGATFRKRLTFRDPLGTPEDLSGYTAACQIRPKPESETLTAALVCSVEREPGVITLSLSAAQTAAISPGTYVYDLCLLRDGIVAYFVGGHFIIHPRVTVPEESE